MENLVIVSIPSKNRYVVVKPILGDEQILIIGDISMSAILIAHANSYDECLKIVENMEK